MTRAKSVSPSQEDQAVRLYLDGPFSPAEIAKLLHLPERAVRRVLESRDVTRQLSEAQLIRRQVERGEHRNRRCRVLEKEGLK